MALVEYFKSLIQYFLDYLANYASPRFLFEKFTGILESSRANRFKLTECHGLYIQNIRYSSMVFYLVSL